jgi:hypothetical protein
VGGTTLSFQTDGNLVLYDLNRNPVWASNTNEQCASNCLMSFQVNGNLVLYKNVYQANQVAFWSSNTARDQLNNMQVSKLIVSAQEPYLQMKDDSGNILWASSFYFPLDFKLTEGQFIQISTQATSGLPAYLGMQGDGNLVMYQGIFNPHPPVNFRPIVLWASNSIGNCKSNCFANLQSSDGNFVIYSGDISIPIWASNTENKQVTAIVLSNKYPYIRLLNRNTTVWTSN